MISLPMEREDNNSASSDNERKWKNIKILGSEYIICSSPMVNSWKILVSNLVEIWTETITTDIALERCQSLNMLLDPDSFDIKETLDAMLNDIPKHSTKKSLDEIELETCIDGIAFKFAIHLTKGSPEQFWNEITKPLCQSSMELQRRHRIILDLIKKKDEEILTYKLSGAQLTRKNIETLPYNKDIFGIKAASHNSKSEDCVAAFQSMMDLYNELKDCESLVNSVHKCWPQQYRDPNLVEPVREPKRESTNTSEINSAVDVNNSNELRSISKMKATSEHSSTCTNESIAIKSEITEQHEDETRPSVSKPKIGLRTEKNPKKQSITNNVAKMPLTLIGQPSKEPKKLKTTPNIYDFIA